MTTRRRFIQSFAAIPPALYFRRALAAPDPSRLALIVGNSSYHDAPLTNPSNDAKAMSGLFAQAGFTVESLLNAKRADMMAAIEKFGAAAKRSETKLVVFYYAGHGVQLDWRNYLLPVDALVERQEHVRERCIDLSLLLNQLSAAKDKTFVIILDACRNNPFGTAYRPEQKGLSQFDAPVGSLLAYATSPGNVASDGDGQNGLYTEHLVRELGRRGTRVEDALKRVRLNVRLASNGAQVPWETTSLESDVFIVSDGADKLTEAEIERQIEADVTEWGRIRNSKKTDDWVGYLRTFPNGRFAEIAQMRLARLLAEGEQIAAEKRREDEQRAREEERRARAEQQRLEAERRERERLEGERSRLAEEQRLAAERRQQEEREIQELRRRQAELKNLEARRQLERELKERERQKSEAEKQAREREQQERQRIAAEQARVEQEHLRREAEEKQRIEEARKREQDLAAAKLQQATGAVTPGIPQSAPASGAPLIDIRPGVAMPVLIPPSTNPYSAGRFPLARIFTVGDTARILQTDFLTGVEVRVYSPRVTKVDYDQDRIEFSNGTVISDMMGNILKAGPIEYDAPVQLTPNELQVGRKWTAAFRRTRGDNTSNAYYDLQIVKRESITVPAGRFDTFAIEGLGWNTTHGARLEIRLWLVPGINFPIRREIVSHTKRGQFGDTERHELVSLRQHTRGAL